MSKRVMYEVQRKASKSGGFGSRGLVPTKLTRYCIDVLSFT